MARREHPRYESTEWPDYEFREFPAMLYPGSKDGGKTPDVNPDWIPGSRKPKEQRFLQEPVIVNNEDEARQVLGVGAKPELVSTNGLPSGPERLKTVEDEKAELIGEAETLGVQVDKRWAPERIRGAIEAFRSEPI